MPEPQQPSSTPGAWQTVSSREVYRTAWIHVREDQVISPRGAPAVYSVVDGVPAVAVVALTADGRVYLVGQHRYPINQYSWELPAGGVDHDEPPLEAARRELREETGLRADTWIALGRHHPANSATSFEMYVFLACDLSEGEPEPDDTELLSVNCVPLDAALGMIASGEITDGPTIIGLYQAWHHLRDVGTGA